MRIIHYSAAAFAAGVLLAGCGDVTNGNSKLPNQTPINLQSSSKLQLAVGTAQLADGTVGLNVVTTFRQSNGRSATLVNTPSITGPAGFTVPASTLPADGMGGSGTDGNTAHISASPQQQFQTPAPSSSPPPGTTGTTFGTTGGVFASGLSPFNTDQAGDAFYVGNPAPNSESPSYMLPFYASTYDASGTAPQPFILGPPAVPFFNDGTFPGSFAGYQTGFTTFKVVPVAGSYNESVLVAAANVASQTFTASATLASTAPLPALPAPAFAEDGKGGGTATIVVPSDPRIVETLIYVVDTKSNLYFTSAPIAGTGSLSFTLPDNLGKCAILKPGCSTNPAQSSPSMNASDAYLVYAASFDYPQFEAEPPGNTSQTPTLTGAGGQADVTLSPAFAGTY
jgi:hypothetical protein